MLSAATAAWPWHEQLRVIIDGILNVASCSLQTVYSGFMELCPNENLSHQNEEAIATAKRPICIDDFLWVARSRVSAPPPNPTPIHSRQVSRHCHSNYYKHSIATFGAVNQKFGGCVAEARLFISAAILANQKPFFITTNDAYFQRQLVITACELICNAVMTS